MPQKRAPNATTVFSEMNLQPKNTQVIIARRVKEGIFVSPNSYEMVL